MAKERKQLSVPKIHMFTKWLNKKITETEKRWHKLILRLLLASNKISTSFQVETKPMKTEVKPTHFEEHLRVLKS